MFNPALVARAFVYVSFPKFLTGQWTVASTQFPGGFVRYLNEGIDTLSTSTPMLIFRATGEVTSSRELFFGNVSGSIGETSAILILIAGLYLLYTKTAFYENMLGMLIGFSAATLFFQAIGAESVPNLAFGLLSGGFLFAMVFMITDPISSAKTREGKLIYGMLAGIITVVIRGFALFAGGVMFAILVANMFAPIIDVAVTELKKSKSAKRGESHA